jgi:Transmembrane secretion effector
VRLLALGAGSPVARWPPYQAAITGGIPLGSWMWGSIANVIGVEGALLISGAAWLLRHCSACGCGCPAGSRRLPGGAEGIEPMAIAVSRPRIAGFRQRLPKEMRGRPDCRRRRSLNLQRPLPDGALMIVASGDRTGDPRRSPFLNRAEPRQGHRYFDCRRKRSLSFSPYPAACITQNHSPEGTG